MDFYSAADLPHVGATLRQRLDAGEVGILPTDTIYGLSGNAFDPAVVARILRLKGRNKPPALVPHARAWARLLVPARVRARFDDAFEEHSGAFTTLWPYSPEHVVLPRALTSSGLVGLRRPQHWITALAAELGLPLVSTSVNSTGRAPMTCLDDLEPSIRRGVDFIVYEGPLLGPASTLVHCETRRPRYEPRA